MLKSPGESFAVISLITLFFCGCASSAPGSITSARSAPISAPSAPLSVSLTLPDGSAVFAPLAADEASREHGLMEVSQLPAGQGMLFVFPQPRPERFWMKNCLIPLDMVFMDDAGTIRYVADHAPICTADPCPTYGPDENTAVRFVLELAAGEAARHGLKPGVVLPIPDTPALKAAAR